MTIDAHLQLDTSFDHDSDSSGFSVTDRRLVRTFYDLMERAQVAPEWFPPYRFVALSELVLEMAALCVIEARADLRFRRYGDTGISIPTQKAH